MKRSIIYSLLAVMILVACRKNDNPKLPDLQRVPTPLVLKVQNTDQVISVQDPASFKGKFTIDLFFKEDRKPQKFDVVVIKNGDKTNQKVIQENITTFPTTIELTGPQLTTMFGAIKVGDKFDIGVNVTTQDGRTYQAFPVVGQGYGAGVANQPGASTSIRYEAVCKYDPSIFAGDFEVLVDEWEDYAKGETVTVTVLDNNRLSFKYKANNAQPIIIKVDPNTNQTSVAKQVYGNYSWGAQYGDFSVETVPSLDNFVAPCEGVISVVLKHTVSAGTFGNFKIQLKKKG